MNTPIIYKEACELSELLTELEKSNREIVEKLRQLKMAIRNDQPNLIRKTEKRLLSLREKHQKLIMDFDKLLEKSPKS